MPPAAPPSAPENWDLSIGMSVTTGILALICLICGIGGMLVSGNDNSTDANANSMLVHVCCLLPITCVAFIVAVVTLSLGAALL